jgi:hypothetical protein
MAVILYSTTYLRTNAMQGTSDRATKTNRMDHDILYYNDMRETTRRAQTKTKNKVQSRRTQKREYRIPRSLYEDGRIVVVSLTVSSKEQKDAQTHKNS